MTLPLKDQTIVIIGGAGLLGDAFSRACDAAGARVVVADIDKKRGQALASELKNASFEHVDLSSHVSIQKLASTVSKKPGHIDGLVHAAYPRTKNYGLPIEKASPKELIQNIELQLGAPLLTTRAFLPYLKKQKKGSIVFLSSIYGVAAPRFEMYEGTSMTMPAEYAAAKGGIISLARYFAALLGPHNIRVNAISPGGIEANQPNSFKKAYAAYAKLGSGLLSPHDISGALVFLLSSMSEKITGQNLIIDAGWTL